MYPVVCALAGRGWVRRLLAVSTVTWVTLAGHAQAWDSRDIGAVAVAGEMTYTPSGHTSIRGSGADIWGAADEFFYYSQQRTGDGEFRFFLMTVANTHPWAKAGLMIRETLAPDSRNVFMLSTPGNGIGLQHRATTGGFTSLSISRWWSDPGGTVRLKIVRNGDTFTGYWSSSGEVWTNAGTVTLPGAPATMHVGIAVTSHDDGVLCDATFDHVSFNSGAPVITSPWDVTATVGTPFSYTISATGTPTSYGASPLPAGLALNSSSGVISGTPTTAGTHQITIGATNPNGTGTAVLHLQISGPAPPPDWSAQDVGAVATAGSWSESGGVLSMRGSGEDIWGTHDEFFLRHMLLREGTLTARLTSLTTTHSWAKAGLMVRTSLDAAAPHVSLLFARENGTSTHHRRAIGAPTQVFGASWSPTLPVWLRIVRAGNQVMCYTSSDGVAWVHSTTEELASPNPVRIGFAVTSHNDGVLATATFDNVLLTPGGSEPPSGSPPNAPESLISTAVSPSQVNLSWIDASNNEASYEVERGTTLSNFTMIATLAANATSYQDLTVSANTTYHYRVRARNGAGTSPYSNPTTVATPPAPGAWNFSDVGFVGVAGSNSSSGNTITIRGSGGDIWGGWDAFRFVYKEVTGDVTVEAQISSLTPTHPWAKAGVMMRAWGGELVSSTEENANIFVYQTPDNVVASQVRASAGGYTTMSSAHWTAPAQWVRLVRTGSRIVSYTSADGVTWTQLASYDGLLTNTLLVGFAVTSHDPSNLATAVFTDPSVR